MSETSVLTVLGLMFAGTMTQTALVFWRLGRIEKTIGCPWGTGKCPTFQKAQARLAQVDDTD